MNEILLEINLKNVASSSDKENYKKFISNIRNLNFDYEWHKHIFLYTETKNAVPEKIIRHFNTYVISNSHIYNKRYLAKKYLNNKKEISDSELIANLYQKLGKEFIREIEGAFTFILYDIKTNTCLVSRDHMGMSALYIKKNNNKIIFASSLELIKRFDFNKNDLDVNAVIDQLIFFSPKKNKSLFKNIQKFPVASYCEISNKDLKFNRYYKYKGFESKKNHYSDDEYADNFKHTFFNVLKEQIESFPETEIGSSLSGGLDSSSIVSSISHLINTNNINKNLNTYSAIFSFDSIKDHSKAFEKNFMDDVIDRYDIKNTNFLEFNDSKGGSFKYLESISELVSEPIRGPNYYINFLMYQMLNEKGIKYHFEGYDGDDVISHGYERLNYLGSKLRIYELFAQEKSLRKRRNLNFSVSRSLKRYVVKENIPAFILQRLKVKNEIFKDWSKIFKKKYLIDYKYDDIANEIFGNNPFKYNPPQAHHTLAMQNPNKNYGVESIAEIAKPYDIHVFFPFFDKNIIDLCLSLPFSQKLNNGFDRYVFRNSMKNILPNTIINRVIKADISPLFINEFKKINIDKIISNIQDGNTILKEILDIDILERRLWRFQNYDETKYIMYLFQLISFSTWMQKRDL